MASELLKNKALIQRLKESDVPAVNFNLADSAKDYSIESIIEEISTPTERVVDLADDLTPGPLREELKGTFDPTQETYEDYLRRINARYGGRAKPKRGLVDEPGSYGGKVFEPKLDIFEDIVLKFNQGTEYKSITDVLAEYTKRTKDPFTKKMVSKGLTRGSKAEKLIKPVLSLLETPEDKVNRVFTEALSTDTATDISVVDKAKVKVAARASVWRANIADKTNLDQAFVNRILNKNPDYIKNKKLFDYLGQTQLLLTDLKDLPLKDQLAYAEQALKGRPVYTGITKKGQNKLMRDPAHKIMEFSLRNFIANEGKGAVKFFDKNGKPIKYKTGLNIPYRDSIISYKGKKHTIADLRKPGYMQKFFPNVYNNQIKINKILNQEIDNPFKKGKKINFGDFMTEVQVKAYGWSPRAGSIDLLHGPAGVKGNPFDNLTFGTKRLNYQLEDINKLYRFGKIDDASRLKLLDAAEGKLKGLQGDDLLNAVVKQQIGVANQIKKGKTFGTTRQETEKLIRKTGITPTKKLTALQELSQRTGSSVDPILAARAAKEEFVDPVVKAGSRVLPLAAKGVRGALTAADLALSVGKGTTGLMLGALLEADPILTGMAQGKTFRQGARDTFIGSAIDAIPGVDLGSLGTDLLKLADTEEQKVAVQNLLDYQKDFDKFNKDLRQFREYEKAYGSAFEESGITRNDLINMEKDLIERFTDIQERGPKVINPDTDALFKSVASKEATKRFENLNPKSFQARSGDEFIDKQTEQIFNALIGFQGATDSFTDAYKDRPEFNITQQDLDDIYEMSDITGAAEGGRIGFAKGPMNPKRRLFLKLMTGIMALPIVPKFMRQADVAKPIVKLANTTTTMPDWFPDLITKVMFKSSGKKVDADIMLYEVKELPGIKIYKQGDGKIRVEGTNEYGKEYQIDYEPPGYELVDESGKSFKTKGDFSASEDVPVSSDPDGNMDFDVEVLDDLDQILGSDTRIMEEFATGKTVEKMKSGEFAVGKAEADLDRAAEEAAEYYDEID